MLLVINYYIEIGIACDLNGIGMVKLQFINYLTWFLFLLSITINHR